MSHALTDEQATRLSRPGTARPRGVRPWASGLLAGAAIVATAAASMVVVAVAVRHILLEDLRESLRRSAVSTAALIDGARHSTFTDSGQTDSPEYRALATPLRVALAANPDLRFAYTGVVVGDSMRFILDGDTTAERAWVGQPDEPTEGELEFARTHAVVVERATSRTAWGSGIRAFAPIAGGTTWGAPAYVGITMDAAQYSAWIRRVYEIAALGLAIAVAMALVIGVRAAQAERRRQEAERTMAELREAALAAAEERVVLQQRLAGRQKMEALGTLAGGVAHDFNNLLTVILGHADLLEGDVDATSEAGESVQAIHSAAMRARDVVRRILLFSRPEAEHRRAVAVAPLIGETVQLLRSTLPSSAEIAWQPPQGQVLVMADPAQLTQVLMNLCVNAGHALPGGRGRIVIALGVESLPARVAQQLGIPEGTYARVSVADNGVGMTEDVRRRIFEPFFTTKSLERGTGLGLAVVEGVLRGHEGAVDVQSREGVGTTFTLYLPLAPAPARTLTPAVGIPQVSPSPSHAARVLLVDDEAPVRQVMTNMLRRAGHSVEAYGDPEQALTALRKTPTSYDCVITDRTMPGLSGLEVAHHVHALAPALPVILVSGAVQEGDREAGEFAAVLAKPPEIGMLRDAVSQVTRDRRPRGTGAPRDVPDTGA